VERVIARTATVTISPFCEGGSTKLDLSPDGGFTPGVVLALDDMDDYGVALLVRDDGAHNEILVKL